jgi:MoaA/NifB/PqqE/SkfB family radical SAM enzyme
VSLIKRVPESQGWIQRIGEWGVRQHTFMPRMIDLEVSRICNLNCPACMRRADTSLAQTKPNGEVYCSLTKFQAIYEQIPTLGTLNFMGDGEPLMNPELMDIIHYASLNDIHTVLTTNGALLTQQIVNQLTREKVYHIHISVDAAEAELYEKLRFGSDWKLINENLRLVGKSGIPLCINVVLTQQNMSQMLKIVQLAYEVGAKEITFLMPICAYGDDTKIRPKANAQNEILFADAKALCDKLGIKWIFPLTLNPTFRRFSFPFIRPEISLEGDLWACCYSLGRGTTWVESREVTIPPGTYNMGNMFKKGFKDVWYGPKYQALRKKYIETEVKKGTIITREDYVRHIEDVEQRIKNGTADPFAHCEICPARWGMACS